MITETRSTTKKTPGTNTCEILVFHHTWPGSFEGNLNYLATNKAQASAHYVAGKDWELGQIGKDTDILWHAGVSEWKWRTNINRFAIGIEIVWPDFTDKQRQKVEELAVFLIKKYGIKKENVVRHKDIAPGRKVDVDDSFWNKTHWSWSDYVNFLFSKLEPMAKKESKYTKIMENVLKETGATPIFEKQEGDEPLTEQETKELIEIAFARYGQRLQKAIQQIK